ncbi:hypothetical protein DM860_017262 [Cuscuta australis]|uniref:Subtilisin-like protease fibronectin type-III domain-containing protein n=1 Tax=Cuscuta australis TaxID=267555 RepID=A0A328E7D2_9ASTE|nr:hypothetical protein DM860_017262 [Cuscuta australis]
MVPARIFLLLLLSHFCAGKRHYIVMLDNDDAAARTEEFGEAAGWYSSTLASVSENATLVYTYFQVMNGFSARMTAAEAADLRRKPRVLSVIPDRVYQVHTTRTPAFLGMDKVLNLFSQTPSAGYHYNASALSDVVIGVLDTGVWPESESFADGGMPAVPSFWRGGCQNGTKFLKSSCNKNLIGAKYFLKGYKAAMNNTLPEDESLSPRDDDGHGTHTGSTAAGSLVPGASLYGYASGRASGMAPQARLAAYKVCWKYGCTSSDILAAMEEAINDNVNILSLSIGGTGATGYQLDAIAIGAFRAMEKGIFVSCSAGNSGPTPFTLTNVAPWITTVGAGTLDRDFPANVHIGADKYRGVSVYSGNKLLHQSVTGPLIYAGDAASGNRTAAKLCLNGSLKNVTGKIVLCDRGSSARVEKGNVVKEAGGIGMVLANDQASGNELVVDAHLLPATLVGYNDGSNIKAYLKKNKGGANATIVFAGTKVGVQPSPVVASFSSRGPNPVNPEILKPDLIAPGVNILAAWTGRAGPTGLPIDTRRVNFNIASGTSMSCPHVSGIAAVLKAAHPDWSPAAIRSALMTTAYSTYRDGTGLVDAATGKQATPFDYGSGHIDPLSAIDPGLVYDISARDYADWLCATGYDTGSMNAITGGSYNACEPKDKKAAGDLNYPSFAVVFNASWSSEAKTQTRTLTSVKPGPEMYTATVNMPVDSSVVKVDVKPKALNFSGIGDKKTYTVSFQSLAKKKNVAESCFGSIEWVSKSKDGKTMTRVASPVAMSWE